jgi:uncharacterized membrane protein required for colicin V production
MIAEATPSAPANAGGLPFNWFDIVVLAVLLFGLYRGKRNGMSKELLPLLQWVVLVPVCGFGYAILGGILTHTLGLDQLWGLLLAYLILAFAVFIVFSILKKRFAEKMTKSSFFSGGEYYLGAFSGMVRYTCALVFVLALLNAPVYTPAEIASAQAFDKKNLGGGLFEGNYIPHLFQIQSMVFKESFAGPLVRKNLAMLLIVSDHSRNGAPAPAKPPPVMHFGTN